MTLTDGRPPARPKGHLLRILGVGFGIAVIVGTTIGTGILHTPGLVAAQLSTPGLIISVWLVGGIYAFCCTLTGVVCHRSRFDMRAVGEGSAFLGEIVLGVAVAPSRGR